MTESNKTIKLDELSRQYFATQLRRHAGLVEEVASALEQNDEKRLITAMDLWHSPVGELREELYRTVKMARGIETLADLFKPAVAVPVINVVDISAKEQQRQDA